MLLWGLLLLLILAISFVLAKLSMKDYTEIPSSPDFGLFLMKQQGNLNQELLDLIYDDLQKTNSIISFERLFKGEETALVIYGSKKLLSNYTNTLGLLELEDYTSFDEKDLGVWEIGIKQLTIDNGQWTMGDNLPQLLEDEQLWWQLIISKGYKCQIKVAVVSKDPVKQQGLAETLVLPENIIKLPKVYSTAQLLDFYQKRSFQINEDNPLLNPQQILKLLWISN